VVQVVDRIESRVESAFNFGALKFDVINRVQRLLSISTWAVTWRTRARGATSWRNSGAGASSAAGRACQLMPAMSSSTS